MTIPVGKIDTLLADPDRVMDLSAEEIVAALSNLETLTSFLTARLAASREESGATFVMKSSPASAMSPAWSDGDLLTVDEAATVLRVTRRWLYRHAKKLPFVRRLSRKSLRFSRAGIARWLATRRP